MKNFRPLLLEDLQVESAGLEVLRLCVNQHLPEAEWVRRHRHDFSQCLFYLSGHGVQQVEGTNHSVSAGSLITVTAGTSHAFEKRSERDPLCLVVDFRLLAKTQQVPHVSTRLHGQDVTLIRQRLSWLMLKNDRDHDVALQAREAATLLDVTGILLGHALGTAGNKTATPVSEKIHSIIRKGDLPCLCLADLIGQSGLQKDHLNRVLKKESGLTLNQMLDEYRLEKAKIFLSDPERQVQQAGAAIGFIDGNYFARWFRKQTGQSPGQWRKLRF
ncbi:MAG: AraC family transcriptional regulator [Verrucomicrobiota bacterium]